VTGFARDDKGKPLSGASIALKNTKDSSVVKLSISGATGQYEFSPVEPGHYFVTISHIGFRCAKFGIFRDHRKGWGTHTRSNARPAARELKETVVTTRKPLVEVKT